MSEIGAILEAVEKLSGVSFLAGFATMLVVILIANYKGYWVWGQDLARAEARCVTVTLDYQARLISAESRSAEWQRLTLGTVGLLETSVKAIAGNGK